MWQDRERRQALVLRFKSMAWCTFLLGRSQAAMTGLCDC